MAIQMRRGNLADFDPTKQMPGEFAVTLDTDSNLNKRVYIAFAAGTVKQLMTVEDATAQMIEATDAATAEAEAWAHGNSFTATEMFTSAGSATVTLAYSPSSINAVKINDVATTAYTRNDKVITFNTAPAVGSTITVIYGVSTSTDNAKYYKEQAANSASTASTKATQASTSATNAANSASTASTKATQAGNSATLSESYAVGGTGTRPGEDTDNAKYYKDQMATYLSGIYHFIGSVNSYADLPTMGMVNGDTYDILTADPTHEIAAGDNVAWTGTKWDKLSGTIATMIGATASSNGSKGLVPAPMIADREKFLRGDGTWANPNTAVDDIYSVMGQMGAKNLIPYPYYEKTHTESGITWTDNGDGTVTANGTATATSYFTITSRTLGTNMADSLIEGERYILTGCPTGGSNQKYDIFINETYNSAEVGMAFDYGNGATFTLNHKTETNYGIGVRIRSGQTVSDLTFKPMLRIASDTDNTYQPYAKTNRQLTDGKAELESVRDYVNELGVKNLIPCPYYRASGYSANGMTTTYDSDGVMTINKVAGSSTAFFALTYTDDNYCLKPNTKYKLLAEFENTTQLSVFAKCGDIDIAIINKKSTGKYAVNFTTPQTLEGRENIAIYATSSDTETNAKVKVMIMPASDINDDTYVPYAMTNKQLTDKLDKCWKLDAGTVIPDNSNLNDYKTPGNYYHLTANVSTVSNIPDNKGFRLTVLLDLYDPAYVEQIFNPIGSYKTYKRYYSTSNTWTDWKVVEDDLSGKANTSDIPTALSQLTADSTHRLVTDTEKTTWNTTKDRVEANTFGSSVSLKSYSSATNKYIVPNDGYVTVYAGNGTEFRLYFDSASVGFEAMRISSTDGYTRQSIFVKKGIKVYGYPVPVSASTYEFDYYPLQE